jgi:MOSC domain-containing protein YiiM
LAGPGDTHQHFQAARGWSGGGISNAPGWRWPSRPARAWWPRQGCVRLQEHWEYWRQRLSTDQLVAGAFGENLTTAGLLESEVRVGDCFQVGTAVLLAVQPRRPCVKLGIRLQRPAVVQEFEQARRSGIYFRVQQPGVLQAGDVITLVQASPYPSTIQDMVDCLAPGPHDQAKVQALLATPYLTPSWRERLLGLLT